MNASPRIRPGQPAQNASGQRGVLPPYLSLLHLWSNDVQAALDELLREPLNPDDRRAFHRELGHENWRYALAAAVRLVGAHCADLGARASAGQVPADGIDKRDLDVLWGRIEHGNWVVPQLVVVALVIDSSFCSRARGLLESRVIACRTNTQLAGLDGAPGEKAERGEKAEQGEQEKQAVASTIKALPMDGKIAASLVAALRIAGEPVNVEDDSDYAACLRQLLAADVDECDLLVQRWHQSLVACFAVRGKAL